LKPRINIITVAVDDLGRSLEFYRDGLQLPTEGIVDTADHVAFALQGGLSFVLYPRAALALDAKEKESAPSSAEFILTHVVGDRQEVDALLGSAEAAGATVVARASEQPWGYAGRFKDLDGHLWEILWNPNFEVED
jgi:predicted lactoylglutathione lyase